MAAGVAASSHHKSPRAGYCGVLRGTKTLISGQIIFRGGSGDVTRVRGVKRTAGCRSFFRIEAGLFCFYFIFNFGPFHSSTGRSDVLIDRLATYP